MEPIQAESNFADEAVEAGEPIVEETKLAQAEPIQDRIKLQKYTLRLNTGTGVFAPPGVLFIGGGANYATKYRAWIEKRFQGYFKAAPAKAKSGSVPLGVTNINASPKEHLFVKWLVLIAVVMDEAEFVDWIYAKHPRLDIRGVIESFVIENHQALRDLAPYFGVLKDKINPQPQQLPEEPSKAVEDQQG